MVAALIGLAVFSGATASGLPMTEAVAPSEGSAGDVLDEATTKSLVSKFKDSRHWAVKALAIVALGKSWHPAGSEMLVEALTSKEAKLRPYALEAVLACDKDALKAVATWDLIDTLVRKQLRDKHKFYHDQVVAALTRIAPDGGDRDDPAWRKWWSKARKDYKPAEWVPPKKKEKPKKGGQEEPGKTVAERLLTRAMDLSKAGLEVVICIDSTGSMQWTIDKARDGVEDIVALLNGITPDFRIGLVHYRDYDVIKQGAEVLEPLTGDVEKVKNRLNGLKAMGGGDGEERVERGLEFSIDVKKVGWRRSSMKFVIIVGDSPPHDEDLKTAKALAKKAYGGIFEKEPKPKKRKGQDSETRPITVSAICVGNDWIDERTRAAFLQISKAGGGSYAEWLKKPDPNKKSDKEELIEAMKKAGMTDAEIKETLEDMGQDGPGEKKYSEANMVTSIVVMTFGSRWRKEVDAFVATFQKYRKHLYFK